MAQLLQDVLKQSPDLRLQGVVESAMMENDLFKVLPFYRATNAMGVKYLRVGSRPSTSFIKAGETVAESAATLEEVDGRIRHIVGDVDILGAADRLAGNAQRGTQLALKASATARLAANALINGAYGTIALSGTNVTGVAMATAGTAPIVGPDGGTGPRMPLSADVGTGAIKCTVAGAVKTLQFRAPGDTAYGTASADVAAGNPVVLLRSAKKNLWIRVKVTSASLPAATAEDTDVACTSSTEEFDGLVRLVDDDMLLDPTGANGDNLTFSIVRRVIRKCKAPPGTRKFLIAGERDLEELCKIYDSLGGATVQMQALPEYGIDQMPVFAGRVPILVISDDVLSCAETLGTSSDCSRLYCAAIGLPNPAEVDAPVQGVGIFGLFAGTNESMAEGRNCAGMFIENLGPRATKDLHGTRVGWDLGLIHFATEGLAAAWGLTPTP